MESWNMKTRDINRCLFAKDMHEFGTIEQFFCLVLVYLPHLLHLVLMYTFLRLKGVELC